MEPIKFSRRKLLGYSLLGTVGGLFGWKIFKQSQEEKGSETKAKGEKSAKKFKPLSYSVPATVYYMRMPHGTPLAAWAANAKLLFQKAGFADFIGQDKLVAVKQHFGEEGNQGYIRPQITREIVAEIKKKGGKPSLIETNTLYRGSRANSYDHILTAYNHGFTLENTGAPIVICDGMNGQSQQGVSIPGKHFDAVYIASDVFFFDSMIVLSHVKGHSMTGMGGTIKNLGMGLASRSGKLAQHADFKPEVDRKLCNDCGDCVAWCPANALYMVKSKLVFDSKACIGCGECLTVCKLDAIKFSWSKPTVACLEKMAEHALGAICGFGGKVGYINFVNHISKVCDCYAKDNPAMAEDVGILASLDPVALDMASYDVTKKVLGKDIFKEMWPSVDGVHTMKYSEALGMGTTQYNLVEVKA